MTHSKSIVVIGLGMVGLRAIERLREKAKDSNGAFSFKITAFGEEPFHAYNRVGLTQYFEHRDHERLLLQPQEFYTDVEVHRSDPVTNVDLTNKTVSSSKGITVSYDYLLFATGSDAFVPPIKGVNRPGVFVYRTISDVEQIIDYANTDGRRAAAVIGGGLLGLEAAKVCVDLGLATSIVERNPWLLSRQIDEEGSRFLHREIEKLKVNILCAAVTEEIAAADDAADAPVSALVWKYMKDQQVSRLDVEMIIVATGIKARDDLAKACGLECHPRGGIVVDAYMKTSAADVYAIGECASFDGQTYGLIAPGYDMADVAVNQICKTVQLELEGISAANGSLDGPTFKGADMSAKLKLLGVHVAAFGDYFRPDDECTPLVYRDPFGGVYKKLLFTRDGKHLIGGMLVGDTTSYTKLHALSKSKRPLQQDPSSLILPPAKGGAAADSGGSDLPDDAIVCSCNSVTKANLISALKDKNCSSVGEVRTCTKAGTGCGGCVPIVTDIVNAEMKKMGKKVQNWVCEHFKYSRKELFDICKVMGIRNFKELFAAYGQGKDGCEVCKPCAGSIFASLWNEPVLDPAHATLQDTNDRFLANIQRGGSYSVVPRIPAGEITPEKLITLGEVAAKYSLYLKITGGQRIDLFGAARQDLPAIWEELVKAGFESGHAYGKALRTVKSCVGSTWCRYGRRDSVGFAVAIEQRYKGIRSPHKLKGGVSGCVRECAEAQGKDFGLIATEGGYNLYVCGNGGATPKHAVLLAKDVPEDKAIKYLDRFLMYYISTADKLQRTARWLEKLEPDGGIEFLKSVIVDDKLGIGEELERQMQALVDTYFCEWTDVVNNPSKREQFRQFVNTDEQQSTIEFVSERGQRRPADWIPDGVKITEEVDPQAQLAAVEKDQWSWVRVGKVAEFPPEGGRAVRIGDTQLAVFRHQSLNKWYATQNMCPHKRAFVLSGGLLGEAAGSIPKVSCPNHKKNFSLEDGKCLSDDTYKISTFEVKIVGSEDGNGEVHLLLPPTDALDAALGTSKHIVRASETMTAKVIIGAKTNDVNGINGHSEGSGHVKSNGVKGNNNAKPNGETAGEYMSTYAGSYEGLWDGIRKTSKKRIEKSDVMLPKDVAVEIQELGDGCGPCSDKKLEW